MQAIILAAGFGSRLKPLTDTVPKPLTQVNGVPLLDNALAHLQSLGVTKTVIVTGYLGEKIEEAIGTDYNGMPVEYVENEIYAQTNNVYSLLLAMDKMDEDVLLLECDLFYNKDLLADLMATAGRGDCTILTSPFDADTMDGTVVFADEKGRVKSLVIKKKQGADFDYTNAQKTVNIYRFSKGFFADVFRPAVELYVKTQSAKSYYELVLGSLIYFGNQEINALCIPADRWCEVDDLEDLARAEARFPGN